MCIVIDIATSKEDEIDGKVLATIPMPVLVPDTQAAPETEDVITLDLDQVSL